jgi:hypothetical protein
MLCRDVNEGVPQQFTDERRGTGVVSIIAAGLAVAISDGVPAHIGAATALVALLAWLAIYLRISAPINKRLRAAAANHTVPADTKELQQRWDRSSGSEPLCRPSRWPVSSRSSSSTEPTNDGPPRPAA